MAIPTTFEKELHKVFDGIDNLENKKYVGRAFYASIDHKTKFKAEFIINFQFISYLRKYLNKRRPRLPFIIFCTHIFHS